MTPENSSFVASSGKWSAVDVSRNPEYGILLSAVVTSISPMISANGKVAGMVVETSKGEIRAEVEADDLYVWVS